MADNQIVPSQGGGAVAPSSPAPSIGRAPPRVQGGAFSQKAMAEKDARFAAMLAKARADIVAGTLDQYGSQLAPSKPTLTRAAPAPTSIVVEGVSLATPELLREINPPLAKLLGEGGGPHAMEARLQTAQNVLIDVLNIVREHDAQTGGNDAVASMQSFEALSPSAMQALLVEFSKPPSTAPAALQPAAKVAQWAAQGETEETLLENWLARGEDAQVNFSRIYHRFARIDAMIQPAEHPSFLFWYTHLDSTTKAAFLLALLHGADTPLHVRFGAAS